MKKPFKTSLSILHILYSVSLLSCREYEMPTVSTSDIKNITATSASGGGNVTSEGGTIITEKGVCWSLNKNPSISDSRTLDGDGIGQFTSSLTRLNPGSSYYVRAYAKNSQDTFYGNEVTFRTISQVSNLLIIADHTVVDKFDSIPQYYIEQVKKMWLCYAGESHSEGIRVGLTLLESLYPVCDVNVKESGTPEANTSTHLRVSRATWGDLNNSSGWIYDYGEEDWFASAEAISRTKAGITYCKEHNIEITAFGFGWCYDFHQVFAHYISATQQYMEYCSDNEYNTRIFFSTAPVDDFLSSGASGWQRFQENDSIRTFVTANSSGILFDFADILCYDNGSKTPATATYNGHTYPVITETNLNPIEGYHFSEAGSLRLAKAMWWMLARIAGWDGRST
jgi:hypothetical protein